MGLWTDVRASATWPEGDWKRIYGDGVASIGAESKTGIKIDDGTALRVSAVMACCRVLAESTASLPRHVYRRLPTGGKERADDHPIARLFRKRVNPEMTAYQFVETAMFHLALRGNAYSEIARNGMGYVAELWPWNPAATTVDRDSETRRLVYALTLSDGTPYSRPPEKVFHVPALAWNGLVGLAPITYAREAIGLSLAAEEFGARFYRDGTHPGAVIEHPTTLSPEAHNKLRSQLAEKHQGLGRAHQFMLLDEGMKLSKVGMDLDDAQFLEIRQFQVTEIARLFRVQPHMIGDLTRATFSNIEVQSLEFVLYTLRPWLVRLESAINTQLIDDDEYFLEFAVEGLLRGDSAARAAFYANARQWKYMRRNEIRELENRNPVPGWDEQDDAAGALAEANGRTAALARSACERLTRKECQAGRKALARDPDGFAAWAHDFYADHASLVSDALALGQRAADAYCHEQTEQLVFARRAGVETVEELLSQWEQSPPERLMRLALEGDACAT